MGQSAQIDQITEVKGNFNERHRRNRYLQHLFAGCQMPVVRSNRSEAIRKITENFFSFRPFLGSQVRFPEEI